jgi:hypothetical protein
MAVIEIETREGDRCYDNPGTDRQSSAATECACSREKHGESRAEQTDKRNRAEETCDARRCGKDERQPKKSASGDTRQEPKPLLRISGRYPAR